MNVLKTINLSVSIILIILLLIAGVYLNKLLNKAPDQQHKTVTLKTDLACDLNQQACVASIEHKIVELRFKQTVKYLTPFDIEVVIKGFETSVITKMNIDFSMLDMQMGVNRFALKKTGKENIWQGMAILPMCVSGRKDWQAKLYFSNDELNHLASYRLTVNN